MQDKVNHENIVNDTRAAESEFLKSENTELMGIVKKLKDSICNLKQEVMEHVQHGCQINMVVSQ